ncbi:MAG TPA: TetR family transcriptional regulator [Polyangiaceae bacterium]
MPRRSRPAIAPRREPVQARSTELVAAIMKAAVRVLAREGAARFTTIRVAEEAGVSVGSLYQYFPNKQSIYRLQLDEWEATGAAIDAVLGDEALSPAKRLRKLLRVFFQSECDEAPLRLALDALTPSYHSAPASRAARRRSQAIVAAFMTAAAPAASPAQRRFGAQLLFATMTSLGKQLSERRPDAAEIDRWADAVSRMLLLYFAELAPRGRKPGAATAPSPPRSDHL